MALDRWLWLSCSFPLGQQSLALLVHRGTSLTSVSACLDIVQFVQYNGKLCRAPQRKCKTSTMRQTLFVSWVALCIHTVYSVCCCGFNYLSTMLQVSVSFYRFFSSLNLFCWNSKSLLAGNWGPVQLCTGPPPKHPKCASAAAPAGCLTCKMPMITWMAPRGKRLQGTFKRLENSRQWKLI